MGRKRRLITDSFPKVKRRKGGPGPGKEDPEPEPGLRGEESGEEPLALLEDKTHLEILRQFDLDRHFGPCTGITRLQRWERAEQLGLGPPHEVLKVLWAHPGDPQYQCRPTRKPEPWSPQGSSCSRLGPPPPLPLCSLWHLYPI